jgi:hypothetical protein
LQDIASQSVRQFQCRPAKQLKRCFAVKLKADFRFETGIAGQMARHPARRTDCEAAQGIGAV